MKFEKNTLAFVLGVVGAVTLLLAAVAAVPEALGFVGLGLVVASGIIMLTGK